MAYTRIPAQNVTYSLVEEERGKDAGRMQTVFLRVRCSCDFLKFLLCLIGFHQTTLLHKSLRNYVYTRANFPDSLHAEFTDSQGVYSTRGSDS